MQRSFKALLLHVGLRHIRLNDLPTLLLGRGTHPRSFEDFLGHRTIGIALDAYSHVLLDVQEHVIRALEDTLSCRVAVKGSAKRIPALSLVRRFTCKVGLFLSGRCWVRTSDLLLVS
jgi:hypothetical protein